MSGDLLARAAVLLLLLPTGLSGQEPAGRQKLTGRLVAAGTGAPIDAAVLRLEPLGRQTLTNDRGRFQLEELPSGEYDLVLRHIAYGTHTVAVDLPPGRNVELTLRVPRQTIALDPIEVAVEAETRSRYLEEEGFYERLERGHPINFLTPEEVDRRATSQVARLLQTLPAVKLLARGLPILRRTGCPPLIYLDGMRFRYLPLGVAERLRNPLMERARGAVYSALRDLSGRNLVAVEVYEGPATIPAEFQGIDTRCGVIALWTRHGPEPEEEGDR